MTRTFILTVMAACVLAPAVAGGRTRDGAEPPAVVGNSSSNRGPIASGNMTGYLHRPISNRIVDLLDAEITLTSAPGQVWESAMFDAAQYNRIGLHVEGETEATDSGILCTVHWQFAPEDQFDATGPMAGLGAFGRIRLIYPGYDPLGKGRLGDDLAIPDLDSFPPAALLPLPRSGSFGPVSGMRAKVVCTPSLIVPSPEGADAGVAGKLRDVKVLLRRE